MSEIFISFDLDGTIVKPEYNELVWFKEIPQLYAKKHRINFEKAKKKVTEEYERVGEDDIRWYSLDYWLSYFGFKVTEKEILRKYSPEIELYPEVIPILKLLRKKYTLIIASAMSRTFIDIKLEKDKIFKYFKRVFSSISDFAMIKKEKAFYEKICKEMGISFSQLIHVGDNYQADYLAPRQVGIKAFYLDRTNSILSDKSYTISNLEEFAQKLLY